MDKKDTGYLCHGDSLGVAEFHCEALCLCVSVARKRGLLVIHNL